MAGQDSTLGLGPDRANKRQVAGGHYKKMAVEHWDIVALLELDYFQGQITKYLMRWRDKNGLVDLEKGLHVYQKYIEVERARLNGTLTLDLLREALRKIEMDTIERNESAPGGVNMSSAR